MYTALPRISPVEAAALRLPGIAHAFFTRHGGVSTGLYAGLNTGTGSKDDRDAVLENRARAAGRLGVPSDRLVTPHQVHGADCLVVEEAWAPGQGPKVDALATCVPGLAIGVGSADCGPVLLADADAGVIAAAHAGWKGAVAGVLEATIATMESLGAERGRIVAVLGPTISAEAYEVGPEFVARMHEKNPADERFFSPSPNSGHAQFDLPAYIVARLKQAGIVHAQSVGLCTYSDEDRFFSYRRATHRGEPDYGRLLAAIALVKN